MLAASSRRRTGSTSSRSPKIVVALGREAGVATPPTARLVESIHDIEDGRCARSIETLDLLAATPHVSIGA